MSYILRSLLIGFCFFTGVTNAFSQWMTQTIDLKKGLNAVYLLVEPYPNDCESIFGTLPIESVWLYNQDFSPVQFVDNQNDLTPDRPDWYKYFPPNSPLEAKTNLFTLRCGQAYLVKSLGDTTITLKGRPLFVNQVWAPNSYNMVGMYVDPQNPPTLKEWFSNSPAHDPLDVWDFESGAWQKIADPSQVTIQSGKPYWVYCHGTSDYQGPVRITQMSDRVLNYPRFLVEQEFYIQNESGQPNTITIENVAAESSPTPIPNKPLLSLFLNAGSASLSCFFQQGNLSESQELPVQINFDSNQYSPKNIRLAVQRESMNPIGSESRYQSLLKIKDANGYERLIGVTAEAPKSQSVATKVSATAQEGSSILSNHIGLWMGFVSVNQVSDPIKTGETNTASDFNFRLLLHVDQQGVVRLLNAVTHFWRNGILKTDPNNPNVNIVDQPGHYVLVTNAAPASLLNDIQRGLVIPDSLRDGRPFANRVSTPMFSLRDEDGDPIDLVMDQTGNFGQNGGEVQADILLRNNDPVNPFHHKYNPQHKYPDTGSPPNPDNDWTVNRAITLQFSDTPSDGSTVSGWGDHVVGGEYQEIIEGLRRDPIQVKGTFRLNKVSSVPVLNDGF